MLIRYASQSISTIQFSNKSIEKFLSVLWPYFYHGIERKINARPYRRMQIAHLLITFNTHLYHISVL